MAIELKLWTNRDMKKSTQLLMNSAVTIFADRNGEVEANACTERRYKLCAKYQRCQRFEPQNEWDKNRMAGLSRVELCNEFNDDRYRERAEKITIVLNNEFEKCRGVVLTIREGK